MIDLIVTLTVLALAVMGIRLIGRGRISPLLQYALWGLLPLRVLVYIGESVFLSLPKSRFNAMYLAEELYRGAAIPLGGQGVRDAVGEAAVSVPVDAATAAGNAGAQGISAGFAWQHIFLLVWIAGAATVFTWLLLVNVRFYTRILRDRQALDLSAWAGALPDMGRLPVYVCDGAFGPCLAGPLRKAVYLPGKVLENERTLRYALIHEQCHSQHGDLIWAAVRNCMLVLFWFHPLIWVGAMWSRRDCELACDAAVIKRIGGGERLAYGRALLELVGASNRGTHLMCAATTMSDSAKGMRERVLRIASAKRTAWTALMAVVLIVALTAACTFTDAADTGLRGVSETRRQKLLEFGQEWAEAYCGRDGDRLLWLSETEEVLYEIGGYGGEEGEEGEAGHVTIGMSSPWPWSSADCKVFVTGPDTVDIYYLFQTSDPFGAVALHTLELTEKDGSLKTAGVKVPYNQIDSKKAFEGIYTRYAFDFLADLRYAGTYQYQVDQNIDYTLKNSEGQWVPKAAILCDPVEAVVYELGLEGVSASLSQGSDPSSGDVSVDLTWSDGTVSVRVVQPEVLGEKGIWIPASKEFVSGAEKAELLSFAKGWADAYCGRDGRGLLELCRDENVFREAGGYFLNDEEPFNEGGTYVGSDPGAPLIGVSSPWPWHSQECGYVLQENELSIFMWYHAGGEKSLGRARVRYEKQESGTYRASAVTLEDSVKIVSRVELEQAYKDGFEMFSQPSYYEAYQRLVDESEKNLNQGIQDENYAATYCDPFSAAVAELNLGWDTACIYDEKTDVSGRTDLRLSLKGGNVILTMIQPGVQGKYGVWVPAALGSEI